MYEQMARSLKGKGSLGGAHNRCSLCEEDDDEHAKRGER